MAEKNNGSVIIYQSWFETAQKLGPEKQQQAIMQILNYGFYGTVPDNHGDLCMDLLFNSWCPLVDAAERHRRGGAPKGNQNAKGHKGAGGRPKKTPEEKLQPKLQPFNENGNSNVNENENKRDGLTPPLSEGEGEATALPGAVGEEEEEWEWGDPLEQLEEWKREHEQSV